MMSLQIDHFFDFIHCKFMSYDKMQEIHTIIQHYRQMYTERTILFKIRRNNMVFVDDDCYNIYMVSKTYGVITCVSSIHEITKLN